MYARIYTTDQPANSKSFDEPAQDFTPDNATTSTSAERMARAMASRARLTAEREARASAAEACRAHWIAKQQARASALANGNSPPTSDGSEAETRIIPDVETARARVIAKLMSLSEHSATTELSDDETKTEKEPIFDGHYYAKDSSSYSAGNNGRQKTSRVLMAVKNAGLDEQSSPVASSEHEGRINDRQKPALDGSPVDDAGMVLDGWVKVDHAAPAPKVMHDGVLMTAAEQYHAQTRAKIETEIQNYAETFLPRLTDMIGPHWQLFDNADDIADDNARMVAEDRRFKTGPQAGRYLTSKRSAWTLKLDYKLKQGKWHERYVNFQDPYYFEKKVSVFTIHPDYRDSVYEAARQQARIANKQNRADNSPIAMIGHVQRSRAEHRTLGKKRGEKERGGSPSVPYNFAVLVWRDGMPFVFLFNGYRGHHLPLVRKTSRSADSAQFELYGIE